MQNLTIRFISHSIISTPVTSSMLYIFPRKEDLFIISLFLVPSLLGFLRVAQSFISCAFKEKEVFLLELALNTVL